MLRSAPHLDLRCNFMFATFCLSGLSPFPIQGCSALQNGFMVLNLKSAEATRLHSFSLGFSNSFRVRFCLPPFSQPYFPHPNPVSPYRLSPKGRSVFMVLEQYTRISGGQHLRPRVFRISPHPLSSSPPRFSPDPRPTNVDSLVLLTDAWLVPALCRTEQRSRVPLGLSQHCSIHV